MIIIKQYPSSRITTYGQHSGRIPLTSAPLMMMIFMMAVITTAISEANFLSLETQSR